MKGNFGAALVIVAALLCVSVIGVAYGGDDDRAGYEDEGAVLPEFGAVGDTFSIGSLTYKVLSGGTTVSVSKNESDLPTGSITIPASVTKPGGGTYSVTTTNTNAFKDCFNLTSVTIPDTVKIIGTSSFYSCSSLTSVNMPDAVTGSLGGSAFRGCTALTSIIIPTGATFIQNNTFMECSSLTSVTIPDTVTSINTNAFYLCSSLTSVTIPDGVTSIDGTAFYGCNALTEIVADPENPAFCSVDGVLFDKMKTELVRYPTEKAGPYTIPDTVTKIGAGAFYGCTKLMSLNLEKINSIGNYAFYGCTSFTSVDIGKATVIGNYAFRGCTGLTSVTMADNVTKIGDYAFLLTGLTGTIDIPDTAVLLGASPFGNCPGLTSIEVSPYNANYTSVDGVLFNKTKTNLIQYPGGKVGPYTMPAGIVSIDVHAFRGFTGLTSVDLGNVVTISNFAFYQSTGLTSVDLGNVVTIGSVAFCECPGLTSVSIPDSTTTIGSGAFRACTGLTSIEVDSDNANYTSVDGVLFNKTKANLIQYPGGKVGPYTIPSGTITIDANAFRGCTGLTSIDIPDVITSIGNDMFYQCTELTSIDIPDNVTSIGAGAFYGCKRLMTVTIPDNVTSIGNKAFNGCSGLVSVVFPEKVASIGTDAFNGCSGLTDMDLGNVKSIGIGAFKNCTGLTSVTIPKSVVIVGADAFVGCTGLTHVNVDSDNGDYTSVDGVLFDKAGTTLVHFPGGKIGSYTIPNGITFASSNVFAYCPGLMAINVYSDNSDYTSVDGVLFDITKTKLVHFPGGKTGTYAISDGVTL